MIVWKRTVTTDSRDRSTEEVTVTEDPRLVARLDDLASEGYYDPEVDVRLEDFAWSTEDGGSVSGSELVLERRHPADPEDVAALIEQATGVSSEEWARRRADRRSRIPTLAEKIERDIATAEAAGEERSELWVQLAAEPTTVVPARLTAMLPRSELEYLDRDLARAEAMAVRGEEIVELQESFVAWAEEQGAEVLGRGWLQNAVTLSAPAGMLRSILGQPGVTSARRAGALAPNANFPLDDVRTGIQVQPFLDAGYDGNRASSRNAHGIWLGILESSSTYGPTLSTNNDGWDDAWGNSRVMQTWECPNPPIACGHALEPCEDLHGMAVASIATADFLHGQKPAWQPADRQNRTGIAQRASVWLATYGVEGEASVTAFNNAVQKAMQDNVDIINHSAGTDVANDLCDPGTPTAGIINSAYNDGIIWINSLGNKQMCDPHDCNANPESAAYGSIAVAGTDAYDDGTFDDQRLCESFGTADGRADWGPIADLAAPAGVFEPMDCNNDYDDDPQAFCAGTSLAAPHVSGAVTLLKDFWIDKFGDASAQSPGRMHSVMLMMGDACSYFSLDGRWGAGRLRMRKFDNPGMDAPWRVRIASKTLSSGNPFQGFDVNPDAGGTNQPLSSDVDALVVTAFCKVANPETAALDVTLALYDWDRHVYTPVTRTYPGEKARIGMSPEAHRYTALLIVDGIDAPQTIPCWVHILFEDNDRDDVDGPPVSIEPYYLEDPYGQGQATQPADCIPAGWC